MHSTGTGQPVETQDVFFWRLAGPVCADRISNCPLDRVLTYKNLIYLLNLQFSGHLKVPIRVKVLPPYSETESLFHHVQNTIKLTFCLQSDTKGPRWQSGNSLASHL